VASLGAALTLLLAPGAGAPAAPGKPVIVGNPAMVLEPQSTGGSVAVDLRNDQAEPVTLHLSVSASQDAGQGAVIAIDGQPPTEATHVLTINARTQQRIRIVVSKAGAEDFDIDVLNGSERIGKIPVRHQAFSVRPTDVKAALKLYEREPTDIRVTNDDRVTHDFKWRLRLDGHDVCEGHATAAAKSSAVLTCVARFGWSWPTRVGTLFRPLSSPDVALIMERVDAQKPLVPLTVATLPASAQFFGTAAQQAVSYTVIVLVLVLGGVVSLGLSQIIPNRLSRISLRERLDELDRMISGLGAVTDSSLRVLLRVERSRIRDVLRSRATYSPEFAAIAAQGSLAVDRLRRRVALVQQLEGILRRLVDAEAAIALSFAQSAFARERARVAQAILRSPTPTDAELVEVEKAIADAAHQLESSAADEAAFQTALATRVTQRQTQVNNLRTGDNETAKAKAAFQAVADAVPVPVEMVMKSTPQSAQAAGAALDRAVAKVGLMIDYVRHASGVTDQDARERMEDRARTFRELLQKSNVTAIAEATRVLQQIRDDVYPEGVRQRLGKNQARIEADPPVVYEHIPMQFSIRFFEPAIDRAMAARGDFHCEWAFGDDLTERGWEITHYYMIRKGSEETFTVKATFTDILGEPVTVIDGTSVTPNPESGARPDTADDADAALPTAEATARPALAPSPQRVELTTRVTVRRPRDAGRFGERSVIELVKLGAALLVAVFGLVAGAQDQIAKLDLLPGLIAVFLVGFGADTIKSLLSSKT
jgi:hypothetical protein